MAGVTVPVPNQPLFTWQPTLSAISVRGSVLANGHVSRLGLYGSVITGTQSVLYIPIIGVRRKPDTIYIHGYHLPVKTICGSTRFRIPLIVRIWNYIIGGINVIAHVEGTGFQVAVHAEAGRDTGAVGVAYMEMGGHETEKNIRLAYVIGGVQRATYVMNTVIAIMRGTIKVKANGLQRIFVHKVYLLARPTGLIELTHKLMARVLQPAKLKMKLFAGVLRPETKKTFKMRVTTEQPKLERTFRLSTRLWNNTINRTTKLSVRLWGNTIIRTIKLSTRLGSNVIERIVKLKTDLHSKEIERTIKLSVHPVPSWIEKVMAYIETNVVTRKLVQRMNVRSTLIEEQRRGLTVHTTAEQVTQHTSVVTRCIQIVQWKSKAAFRFIKDKVTQLLRFQAEPVERHQKVNVPVLREYTEQTINLKLQAEHIKRQLYMFIHYLKIKREPIYVDFDVLPLVVERNLRFRPSVVPQVKRLNVMVTVCQTWLLSYLNFVPDKLVQELDVRISTCSHMMSSLLQWYLTNGNISNESYGNEVIFDLGEVDPIGPIPPVPSRQWEGGYVEDPFKGVGYVPSSDSVGYGSPSAADWVSNAKMWWNNPTEPFTGA